MIDLIADFLIRTLKSSSNCEKQSVANNTGSGEDLSEVAFLLTIVMVGVLQEGAPSTSIS